MKFDIKADIHVHYHQVPDANLVDLFNDLRVRVNELQRGSAMNGKFVSTSGNDITLSHGNKGETTHAVAPDATVTIDGDEGKLADLKAGDDVSLSGNPATSVVAHRAK